MWPSFASGFPDSTAKQRSQRDTTNCWVTARTGSSGGSVYWCWCVPGAYHCAHYKLKKQSQSPTLPNSWKIFHHCTENYFYLARAVFLITARKELSQVSLESWAKRAGDCMCPFSNNGYTTLTHSVWKSWPACWENYLWQMISSELQDIPDTCQSCPRTRQRSAFIWLKSSARVRLWISRQRIVSQGKSRLKADKALSPMQCSRHPSVCWPAQ